MNIEDPEKVIKGLAESWGEAVQESLFWRQRFLNQYDWSDTAQDRFIQTHFLNIPCSLFRKKGMEDHLRDGLEEWIKFSLKD